MSRRQRACVARVREARAWDLYAAGRTTREIASELGVGHQAVSKMLRRVEADIRARLIDIIETEKIAQLVKLQKAYAEAFAAWEASKKGRTRRTSKTVAAAGADPNAGTRSAQVTTTEMPGDPRYLAEARGALAQIARLLGLNMPDRVQVTQPATNPYADFSDEELHEVIAKHVTKH